MSCLLTGAGVAPAAHSRADVKLREFAGVRRGDAVVFRLHGLRPRSIKWGRMYLDGRVVRVSLARLVRASERGRLRIVLVHSTRGRRRTFARGPNAVPRRIELIVAVTPPRPAAPTVQPISTSLAPIPADARYVSPRGSDSNPGTRARPWRTLDKATSAASPGDTVVLEAGTYGARGTRTNWTASGTAGAPITFIGDPSGPRPTILGYDVLYGSDVHVMNLRFDGPTGKVDASSSEDPGGQEVMIWTQAPGIWIYDCEIENSHWHAGIYLTGADGVRLVGNYIHDNGDFSDPAQANLDHGIYWASGDRGLIAENLIVHNVADGVQLYPDATGVEVARNTIVGNGKSGVIIAESSARNTIANNVVVNNTENSIRSWSLTGGGNVVRHNLVWNNGSGNLGSQTSGLRLSGNVQSAPRFAGPGDYRLLATSPGYGWAGASF